MAEPVLLKNAAIWLGGYDLGGALNSINLTAVKAELDNGRFGDGLEVVHPGLKQIGLELAGFFAAGAGEPDPLLWGRLNSTPAAWPLTICPPTAPTAAPGTAGNIAYAVVGDQLAYILGAAHGELMPFSVKTRLRSLYDLYRQTINRNKTLVIATTNGPGQQLGAVPAGKQLIAILDVFDIDAGSWTLTIESDATDAWIGAETVRATFTAVTAAPARQVVKIAAPITDTWWRTVMTKVGGTDLTYAASMGIAYK